MGREGRGCTEGARAGLGRAETLAPPTAAPAPLPRDLVTLATLLPGEV